MTTPNVTEADTRATELLAALVSLPPTHPDRAALRERAIETWLPMANRLARRYARRGEPFNDLAQTAAIGLIKAIDGFDPARGADFVSYAIPTILGELKRHFRDRTWSLRVPRRLQELRLAIGEACSELGHVLQRAPTVTDIAAHLDVSEEAVLEALESGHAYRTASLDAPVRDGERLALGDTIGSEELGFDLTDLRVSLRPAMACLTERERRIVILRFYGNMTQSRIAEQTGISQMHVSRLLVAAMGKLRAQLSDPG